jgi:exonuclease III
MMLQETWLYTTELPQLDKYFNNYSSYGVSGMNEKEKIICGRKYGGVACLWRSDISRLVTPLKTVHKRITGVIIELQNEDKILVLNVYLPCDNYSKHTTTDEFIECVNTIDKL